MCARHTALRIDNFQIERLAASVLGLVARHWVSSDLLLMVYV